MAITINNQSDEGDNDSGNQINVPQMTTTRRLGDQPMRPVERVTLWLIITLLTAFGLLQTMNAAYWEQKSDQCQIMPQHKSEAGHESTPSH